MDVSTFYKKRKKEKEDIESSSSKVQRQLARIEYSILAPSSKLKLFHKQEDAIKYRGSDNSLGVFSFEHSTGGKRMFLVSGELVFWNHYIDLTNLQRRHYEVIAEQRPCKLYLDLEFKKRDNEKLDGNTMVNNLIQALNTFLQKTLQVTGYKEDILILDSSSEKKFSNHLIYPGLVFRNNQEMGHLIRSFVDSLIPVEAKQFQVKKGDEIQWFIDLGVYTKNRNFRLYLSAKYGKSEILTVSANDIYTVKLLEENHHQHKFDLEKEIFFSSLVTYTPGITDFISFKTELTQSCRKKSEQPAAKLTNLRTGEKSPFLEIDDFVMKIIAPGFIRKWNYIQEESIIIYDVGGTRYCGNVGREHKSNNIRFVCSLKLGILNQKCYDPDCAHYRGPDIPIAPELLPWTQFTDWDPESTGEGPGDPEGTREKEDPQ
ncbi:DNA-directed primase/polymerase protein [Eurytemora carolleeae]|uniref:DNA-directed primase/polymerase protein n=1 Tax=Eurytemora carolleeae TaxID=1294199 RepID=UPI000C78D3B2|nr:DNA-directed primase/polymerase protein [Eurytemora carolleeae]|eukprot:XP_023342906.1 DNA-directed primase/polymerase protein-like [Eurytemora affinis]